jgi:transcriptional regulator with XRE-family HTH domain
MKKIEKNMHPHKISVRLKELRKVLGFKSAMAFADALGLKYTTYLNYEKRRVPPSEFIAILKEKYGQIVNIDGLFNESEPLEKNPSKQEKTEIKTPNPEYDLHGGWVPHETKGEYWEIMQRTHEILKSDTVYRSALISNVRAFHKAIIGDQKIDEQAKEIGELKDQCNEFKDWMKETKKYIERLKSEKKDDQPEVEERKVNYNGK